MPIFFSSVLSFRLSICVSCCILNHWVRYVASPSPFFLLLFLNKLYSLVLVFQSHIHMTAPYQVSLMSIKLSFWSCTKFSSSFYYFWYIFTSASTHLGWTSIVCFLLLPPVTFLKESYSFHFFQYFCLGHWGHVYFDTHVTSLTGYFCAYLIRTANAEVLFLFFLSFFLFPSPLRNGVHLFSAVHPILSWTHMVMLRKSRSSL